jgi:glutaredoxin
MPRALFAVVALLLASAVAAQAYRWVDKDGKVHYSQTPPQPADAVKVQKQSASGSVVESSQLPYATQQAAKNFPVTIYTSQNCAEPCKEARLLLSQRGVPFREVAVTDEKGRAELKTASGGDEVPVLIVGKQVTKGYSEDMWHNALDSAGYPRSGPPLAAKAQKPEAPAAAKAEAPQQADATQAPSGRYAPPPPDAKEAKEQAERAARTTGRYATPAGGADAAATPGPYAPK